MTQTERQERLLTTLTRIQDDKHKHSPATRTRANGACHAIHEATSLHQKAPGASLRPLFDRLKSEEISNDGAKGHWGYACFLHGYRHGLHMYQRCWKIS